MTTELRNQLTLKALRYLVRTGLDIETEERISADALQTATAYYIGPCYRPKEYGPLWAISTVNRVLEAREDIEELQELVQTIQEESEDLDEVLKDKKEGEDNEI